MTQEKDPSFEKMLTRFSLISPLLAEGLEAAEARRRRQEILSTGKLSDRTLRRLLAAYRKSGIEGLRIHSRADRGFRRALSDEIFAQAVALKEELPQRSVARILDILEGEKTIKLGDVARSTLTRHLAKEGLTDRKAAPVTKSRRFQKEHRNVLWQSDLKYGPYLPNPEDPKRKIRTYLVAFIDDATRLLCHGEFYTEQKLPVLEDCFRKAVLKRGLPDNVYIDNGKIFVSRWFRLACARLNIRHITAAAYSPESKGKIERWNRTVEDFLAEISLEKPNTLAALNQAFAIWREEGYNHRVHSALPNVTPAQRFQDDEKRLRFVTLEECRDAFLWEESRRVDKAGCIKLQGNQYEVGLELIRKTVDVRYDPFNLEIMEIWLNGEKKGLAKPLVIHEFNGIRRKTAPDPKAKNKDAAPTVSRLLSVLNAKGHQRSENRLGAISYRRLEKEGDKHV